MYEMTVSQAITDTAIRRSEFWKLSTADKLNANKTNVDVNNV